MSQSDYLREAISLVQRSPLLTPGQKSLYAERLKTVSEAKQQEVITFLKTQHDLLEKKLKKIPTMTAIKRIIPSLSQKMEER